MRMGFLAVVEGMEQKWRSVGLHTFGSHFLPLSASVFFGKPGPGKMTHLYKAAHPNRMSVQAVPHSSFWGTRKPRFCKHAKAATVVFK